jgi:uncharacterized protein YqjF (DUF2071 family)
MFTDRGLLVGFKVFSIPYKYGKMYIEQTGCLIEIRVEEHNQYICLFHPKKSIVVECSINLGRWIQIQNIIILVKRSKQIDWILKEVIEIDLHPDNMNREDSFSLSQAWKPVIHDLTE